MILLLYMYFYRLLVIYEIGRSCKKGAKARAMPGAWRVLPLITSVCFVSTLSNTQIWMKLLGEV